VHGLEQLLLFTTEKMTLAHRLYASLGFTRDASIDTSPAPGVELLGFRAIVPAHPDPARCVRERVVCETWWSAPARQACGPKRPNPRRVVPMSKNGRKRHARRKKKANHGKRPNS
jgi:hypothetical protein